MSRLHRSSSAFTLIELILVLAILAIVAAAIAPSLRAFTIGRGNQDTATMILALAEYARTQAVSEGRTYRLNVDATNRAIWVTAQDGASYTAPGNDFGKKFTTQDGSRLETDMTQRADGTYVEFQPGGRCEPARIWVTDKLNNVVEVASASATELFRIVPPSEVTR